jgi:hypothetical protein
MMHANSLPEPEKDSENSDIIIVSTSSCAAVELSENLQIRSKHSSGYNSNGSEEDVDGLDCMKLGKKRKERTIL